MDNNYNEITLLSNNVYVVNDRNINWGGEVNHNFEILNNLNKNANLKIKYNGEEVNYRVTGDNVEVDLNSLSPNTGKLTLNVNNQYLTAFSGNQENDIIANIEVPVKTSDLANDSGFITANDVVVPAKTSDLTNDSGFITLNDIPSVNVPTKVSQLTNDSGYLTQADVTIPSIPSNVSEFNNDAGYLTNADLNVPTKTSELTNDSGFITLNDVSVPTKTSELTNDSGYLTQADINIPTVPTNVSEFNNDIGYLTQADVIIPSIPSKTSDLTNDSGFITSADVPTKTSDLTNDSGFITSADIPTINLPTKTSDLENDSGFITSDGLANVATTGAYTDLVGAPTVTGVLTLKKDGQVLGTFNASQDKTINFESSSFQTFETERFTVINCIKIAVSETLLTQIGYALGTFVPYNFFSKIQYRVAENPLIRGCYYKETQEINGKTYYVALLPITAEFIKTDSLDVFIPYYQMPKYENKFISTTSNEAFNFFTLSSKDEQFEGSAAAAENRSFTRILPNTNISEVF